MISGQSCPTVIIGGVDLSHEFQIKAARHRRLRTLLVAGIAATVVAGMSLAGIVIVQHESAASTAPIAPVGPCAPAAADLPSAVVKPGVIPEPHIQAF